ncbi:MAG: GTP-binding protein [Lachnospiraceae bacterium]|nr:GTP-binding protein [Lachnospiraceae bacterium]
MIPVYMINGFLESGKTEFIKYTIAQPYFQTRGKTLLIVCEEGEIEYEESLLRKSRTVMEVIEDEEEFSVAHLKELETAHRPERIIIEYNGMWNVKDMKLPGNWSVEQQITTIDASTFPMFYTNMKSLVAEMVRKSEMIIFNRCDGIKELSTYKRNVKAVNPQAEIIFEDSQGEVNELMEEELPYDLKADVIVLDNKGYGIWYLDIMDHMERYEGKTVQFVAMVLRPRNFPKGYFVPGRMAMTCCAEDMAFLGYACHFDGAEHLPEKSWVRVTATIKQEYFKDYRGEGPVLYAESITAAKPPKETIIDFSA